jgi:hypothetical protein
MFIVRSPVLRPSFLTAKECWPCDAGRQLLLLLLQQPLLLVLQLVMLP